MSQLPYETSHILSAIQRKSRNLTEEGLSLIPEAFTQAGAQRAAPRASLVVRKLTTRSLLGELDQLKKRHKRTPPSVALYVAFLAVFPMGDYRRM